MVVACIATLTVAAFAAETNTVSKASNAEQWVLTLGGVGQTTTSGATGTSFGVDVGLGRTGHLALPLEVGVRQGVAFNGNSVTVATTKVYADWTLFSLAKAVDVFAGANIGAAYGNTALAWTAAPEAGVRVWVKKDVASVLRAEAPFDLNAGKYTDTVRYFLGFQVKF